jgi:DNA-binding transcriptional regulator YhcF (GntR family)
MRNTRRPTVARGREHLEARGDSGGKYKYQRLRERLRDAIVRGELNAKLPGERELARRYGANAKTINKALADLTIEGLLVRHVGRGTFVASDEVSGTSTWNKPRTFGWLDVASQDGSPRRQMCRMATELIGRKGHRVELLNVSATALARCPEVC